MKNLKYFPFERNRYFYGKFLSVDDFEAEQRYMNDKRRLLNRFLHGYGVVCGLQVVEVDDMTISIESGLALDFSGREILMASPITKRLSAIDGYSASTEGEEDRRELYLCIAYAEQKTDPVHNITRSEADEEEYNKYAEGYRLFVTTQEAEQEGPQFDALYEDRQTIFHGNGIRIWQTVPRYIQSGEEAEILVVIQKEGQMERIAFSYQMRLDYMEQKGNSILTVEFDERRFAPSDTYVLKGSIRAKPAFAGRIAEGSIEIVPDSFSLTIGDEQRKEAVYAKFRVKVSEAGASEMVWKNYYQSAMEDLMKDSYHGAVYLAKLEVIRAGDTYVIEGVENLPYRQYVWNNMLGGALEIFRQKQDLLTKRVGNARIEQEKKPDSEQSGGDMPVRTGSVIIDLGIGGVSGQKFYSSEIVHGLGPGQVFVSLGLARDMPQGKQVIYGNQDIFSENTDVGIAMAAKADLDRGSFVIGIQCLRNLSVKKVKICWMAVSNQEKPEQEIRHLLIHPDIANLTLRESRMFEASIDGKLQRHIRWSVREAEGGTIDQHGCYTAPNRAGVYQIMAESMEEDGVRAYAYVIVRDIPAS